MPAHPRNTNRVTISDTCELEGDGAGTQLEMDLGGALKQSAGHSCCNQGTCHVGSKLLCTSSLAHPGDMPVSLVDAPDGVTVTGAPSEDHLKALRKLGYPEVDEGTRPSSLLSKVIHCATKRLKKLGEMMPSTPAESPKPPKPTDPADPTADATKSGLQQKSLVLIRSIYKSLWPS